MPSFPLDHRLTVLDKILNFFLTLVHQLYSILLKLLERVENAENIEVLIALATAVVILSVVLWSLKVFGSLLDASSNILEHTANLIRRAVIYSAFALFLLLAIYYIFALERQCFHEIEKPFTSCLNKTEWENKQIEKPYNPPVTDKGK